LKLQNVETERAQHQSQRFGQSKASKAACKKLNERVVLLVEGAGVMYNM
jgi:hypothetical protein